MTWFWQRKHDDYLAKAISRAVFGPTLEDRLRELREQYAFGWITLDQFESQTADLLADG